MWLECDFFSEAQATESPIYLSLFLLFHKLFLLVLLVELQKLFNCLSLGQAEQDWEEPVPGV